MTLEERKNNLINNLTGLTQQADFHKKQFESLTAQALQVQGALTLINTLIAEEEKAKGEACAEEGEACAEEVAA